MIYQINRNLFNTLSSANDPKVRTKTKEEVIAIINQQAKFIKKNNFLKD